VLLKALDVALVAVVVYLVRRRGDWLVHAGWATLALICTLGWLVPWYVLWVLPLAALGTSLPLRRATNVLTVFLVLTFMPATGITFFYLNINPMDSGVGHKSFALQQKLAHNPVEP
jgi:hypothetical protein